MKARQSVILLALPTLTVLEKRKTCLADTDIG